jgi:hypothetical protein
MSDLIATYHDEQKKYRLKIYRDSDCYDGPLKWGWHLNFADRDRNYTLDRKRENGKPMDELRSLVSRYGDAKKVRRWLKQADERRRHGEPYVEYDKSRKLWLLTQQSYSYHGDYKGKPHWEYGEDDYFTSKEWHDEDSYIMEQLSDDVICTIANEMMTDGVKLASYDFSYYNGEPSFDDEVEERMTGLMWLEKDDYLKDSGGRDDRWHLPMTELMKGMIDSIQRWARGDVYGFVLEKAVNWHTHRTCLSEEREDMDYDETDWEEVDSCWGYYEEPEDVAKMVESEHGLPKMLEAS